MDLSHALQCRWYAFHILTNRFTCHSYFAVLFSVVVLHWVTSKDSTVQITQGSSGATGATNPNSSTLRSNMKGTFGDGVRTHKNATQGERTVTTHISAMNQDLESDGEDSIQLKKIRVQVEHTHTVERGASREASSETTEDMERVNHRSE